MSAVLKQLFENYIQDFDLLFERDTDPIDDFCRWHNREDQVKLLAELRLLYADVVAGRKTIRSILDLGLEYYPDGGPDPKSWLPRFIEYLETSMTK